VNATLTFEKIKLQGREYLYRCDITHKSEVIDVISFLQAQVSFPKMYFREKKNGCIRAAVGNVLSLHEIPELSEDLPPTLRFFGGMSFTKSVSEDNLWNEFPPCYFFLPQIEVFQDLDHCIIYRHHINAADSIDIDLAISASVTSIPKFVQRKNFPEKEDFCRRVFLAQETMKTTPLSKVVLARRSDFQFCENLEPYSLLKNLPVDNVTNFLLQFSEKSAFIGATPEKFYSRVENVFETEALAATRSRGSSLEEDIFLQNELFSHEKDLDEFHKVADFLGKTCKTLCKSATDSSLQIYKTTYMQHLYKTFSGVLKDKITDLDIVTLLHPTPALGGMPKEEALPFLEKNEDVSRGWYGSPLGWVSPKEAFFSVAIRSALVLQNQLSLYSGVGIVPKTKAEDEWEELETKIFPFTRIFYED
jgi:menaquinone-specific isochorismate synthase